MLHELGLGPVAAPRVGPLRHSVVVPLLSLVVVIRCGGMRVLGLSEGHSRGPPATGNENVLLDRRLCRRSTDHLVPQIMKALSRNQHQVEQKNAAEEVAPHRDGHKSLEAQLFLGIFGTGLMLGSCCRADKLEGRVALV